MCGSSWTRCGNLDCPQCNWLMDRLFRSPSKISGHFSSAKSSSLTCSTLRRETRRFIISRIAIMQGRLLPPQAQRFQSFPREGWRKEFAFAAEAGLDAIEWIYDEYGEDVNPLASNDGVTEIKGLSQQSGIAVASVCADYFMDCPLVSATGSELTTSVERLSWLLDRCRLAEIERVVLPFV